MMTNPSNKATFSAQRRGVLARVPAEGGRHALGQVRQRELRRSTSSNSASSRLAAGSNAQRATCSPTRFGRVLLKMKPMRGAVYVSWGTGRPGKTGVRTGEGVTRRVRARERCAAP
jgi:hypothetical protein